MEQRRVESCRTEELQGALTEEHIKEEPPCQLGEEKCPGLCEVSKVTGDRI